MNIFISNLSFHTNDEDLRQLFSPFGEVVSSKLVFDRETGKSRGFGFVEMPKNEEGQKAIDALEGKNIEGRYISVSVARPKRRSNNIF